MPQVTSDMPNQTALPCTLHPIFTRLLHDHADSLDARTIGQWVQYIAVSAAWAVQRMHTKGPMGTFPLLHIKNGLHREIQATNRLLRTKSPSVQSSMKQLHAAPTLRRTSTALHALTQLLHMCTASLLPVITGATDRPHQAIQSPGPARRKSCQRPVHANRKAMGGAARLTAGKGHSSDWKSCRR